MSLSLIKAVAREIHTDLDNLHIGFIPSGLRERFNRPFTWAHPGIFDFLPLHFARKPVIECVLGIAGALKESRDVSA
jgi:hypothetical protein